MFDTFQVPYSALQREHEEWLTKAAEAGIGIIVRGGAAQGEPGAGEDRERRLERWKRFQEAGLHELRQPGESRTTFVLRYTLAHPHSDTNIVGTTRIGHLNENLAGIQQGPLPADIYAEAKSRLDAVGETAAEVE